MTYSSVVYEAMTSYDSLGMNLLVLTERAVKTPKLVHTCSLRDYAVLCWKTVQKIVENWSASL